MGNNKIDSGQFSESASSGKLFVENIDDYTNAQTGEKIDVFYWGYDADEHLLFGTKIEQKAWLTGEVDAFLGGVLPVTVEKSDDGKYNYLVDGLYKGVLPVTPTLYQGNNILIKNAIRNLQSGDVIHCEILTVNKSKRVLHLKWNFSYEVELINSRESTRELASKSINKSINKSTRKRKSKKKVRQIQCATSAIEDIINSETVELLNSFKNDCG